MSEITRRDALIAACRANREDDLPRLVFADYLDETGSEKDAARARLIRRQREAAGIHRTEACWALPCGCRLCEDAQLLFPCGDLTTDLYLKSDRGFVTSVVSSAEWWLQHGDDLVREHDVQRVRLTTLPEVEIVSNDRNAEYHVALRLAKNRVSVVMPRGFLSRYQGSPTVAAANSLLRAHWPSVAEWELPSRLTAQATWGPVVIEPRAFVYATVT